MLFSITPNADYSEVVINYNGVEERYYAIPGESGGDLSKLGDQSIIKFEYYYPKYADPHYTFCRITYAVSDLWTTFEYCDHKYWAD